MASPSGQRGGEQALDSPVVVEVEEGEAAGVFGLGGAHQAPDAGRGEVGDVVAGRGRHRAPGDDDEPGLVEPLVGEPGLEQVQARR